MLIIKFEKLRHQKIKDTIISFLSVTSVVIYPCMFMLLNNIERAKFSDIISISEAFILIGIIALLLNYIIVRDINKASVISSISLLLLLNFSLIEEMFIKVFPMFYYWHVLMILLTIILIIAYLIKSKATIEISKDISKTLLFVFLALILLNGIIAAPEIIKKNTEQPIINQLEIQARSIENNSNVYFFLFDEYGGYDNLLRYTGYDNSLFYDEMENLGFNISKHSRNYTHDSYIEIPNLLNLAFVNNSNMSYETMKKALHNPSLFRLFKENGYKLNIISDYGHIPIESSEFNIDYAFTTDMYEITVENLIIENTVYYPFLLNQYRNTRIVEVESMFHYVSESWKIQPENLFTFAYISFPHLPWVVDEFGNNIPLGEKQNWQNSDTYLGQLKYSSKKILELVQTIIEKDPDATIIIQSDHGYRQPIYLRNWYDEDYDDWDLEMKYIRNILNVVYYKGEKMDIKSLSGVNTLITVINRHFGMNYELLEQPK